MSFQFKLYLFIYKLVFSVFILKAQQLFIDIEGVIS